MSHFVISRRTGSPGRSSPGRSNAGCRGLSDTEREEADTRAGDVLGDADLFAGKFPIGGSSWAFRPATLSAEEQAFLDVRPTALLPACLDEWQNRVGSCATPAARGCGTF